MCHWQMVLNCTNEKIQVTSKSIDSNIAILCGILILEVEIIARSAITVSSKNLITILTNERYVSDDGNFPCDSPGGSTTREDFVTAPSIPQTHVPHSALRRQMSYCGDGLHHPRTMTVNYGRDCIKLAQWNDISA